jgi:hypothetical protein
LPSGRSAGSTCHSDPVGVDAEQIRISRVARSVATTVDSCSGTPSAGSAPATST